MIDNLNQLVILLKVNAIKLWINLLFYWLLMFGSKEDNFPDCVQGERERGRRMREMATIERGAVARFVQVKLQVESPRGSLRTRESLGTRSMEKEPQELAKESKDLGYILFDHFSLSLSFFFSRIAFTSLDPSLQLIGLAAQCTFVQSYLHYNTTSDTESWLFITEPKKNEFFANKKEAKKK